MQKQQKDYIQTVYVDIKKTEQQLKDKPMPELTQEDFFLFQKTGNRLVYETAYFGRRRYLTVYAILTLWEEELAKQGIIEEPVEPAAQEQYRNHLEQTMLAICDEQFWALPAHVNFDKINDPDTRYTIDLFAAETAQALSEIICRLNDQLSKEVIERVQKEVCRRVLKPFVQSSFPYSWWETIGSNWSAVCAGSVGMTVLNMDRLCRETECAQLPKGWQETCIKRVCDSMQCYLNGMEQDGTCTEGLAYYNYGMSFYAAFVQACEELLKEPSDTQKWSSSLCAAVDQYWRRGPLCGELYHKRCEQIALFQQKCYFGGGISLSFSDGGQKESFLPGLTAYLKYQYPQIQIPDYRLARPFDEDTCYRYLINERNISWLLRYGKEQFDEKLDNAMPQEDGRLTTYLLPSAQWLICKDNRGNGFAAKGGNNDENHNHNDIGHFLCVYNGEMLLTDLGAGEYTKDYFGQKRYEILCNRSLGHSVPIINNEEQGTGKEYYADCFEWNDKEHVLNVSFGHSYPQGDEIQIIRQIKMSSPETINQKDGMQILVTDTFEQTANQENNEFHIEENLITAYKPTIQNDEIIISGTKGKCHIQIEGVTEDQMKIIPCDHSDHAGNAQIVYRIGWELVPQNHGKHQCNMQITFTDL